jgi:hypothetical protein
MATKKSKKSGGSWKKERASVNEKGKSKPRSNKYSGSDSTKRPKPGTRDQYWRAGYTRKDGTRVKGHYVKMPD